MSDGYFDSDASRLHDLLTRTGLRSLDARPHTIFAQIVNQVKRLIGRTSAVEANASMDPNGIPIIGARLEFSDDEA